MISFYNNIAVGSENDNFRYDGLFTQTPPGSDPSQRINTLNTFGSYAGAAGINLNISGYTAFGALPQTVNWTSRGLSLTAERGGPPVIFSPNPSVCTSTPTACPNQVFGQPHEGFSAAAKTGISTA